jgi:flagellar protein FlaG
MDINAVSSNAPPASQGSGVAKSAAGTQPAKPTQQRQDLPVGGGAGAAPQADLEQAVSALNSKVQAVQRDLNFSIDEDSGRTIVKVVDSTTDEIIRQIPSEEVLALARNLGDVVSKDAAGLLVKAEA